MALLSVTFWPPSTCSLEMPLSYIPINILLHICAYCDLAELVTDMYARSMFQALNFDSNRFFVLERYPIPLKMCGSDCWANPEVILMSDDRQVFCVVQEDKPEDYMYTLPNMLSDAQLMAGAIAVAQHNNTLRDMMGLPVKNMTILAIALVGMVPVFYRVPVSLELQEAFSFGGPYPTQTIVKRCRIEAPHIRDSLRFMRDIEYRKYVIQHYLLFRDLLDENSRDIMA